MQLVEQHIIRSNHPSYKECDDLAWRTKNLYNASLYVLRQAYIKDKTSLLFQLHELMKNTPEYKLLPAKVSSSVLMMLQANYKAFFKAVAAYSKSPEKFLSRPRLPKYLDTKKGRFVVAYTNQAVSKKVFKAAGKIKLSQTAIEFPTRLKEFKEIDCVRIVPRSGFYVIEVVYSVPDVKTVADNGRYAAVDLGVNNLAALSFNEGSDPILFRGGPLKSVNQFYNKKRAHYQSLLETRNKGAKTSKRTRRMDLKRKCKIDHMMHCASKAVVQELADKSISILVVGKNDGWKQDANLGVRNNQNFVQLPHSRFVDMLVYKCERAGIKTMLQEESYTSKASFLDSDFIPVFGKEEGEPKFSGYREGRGLYKLRGKKHRLNADVNGSLNILRKAIPNAFDALRAANANGLEGVGVRPKVAQAALNGRDISVSFA